MKILKKNEIFGIDFNIQIPVIYIKKILSKNICEITLTKQENQSIY